MSIDNLQAATCGGSHERECAPVMGAVMVLGSVLVVRGLVTGCVKDETANAAGPSPSAKPVPGTARHAQTHAKRTQTN